MSPAIRQVAFMSTARGCGFGALAIVTGMFGLLGTPTLSLKLGGVCFLLTAAILILKAWRAPLMPYKKTELWLLLPDDQKPAAAFAQTVIASARVEAFYRFAHMSATLAAVFLTGALLATLFTTA
jgi:hypothetical protein